MPHTPAWQESLDPALMARLLRPLVAPGLISRTLARRILGWVEYFSGRLPLLEELARRKGLQGGLRTQEVPIVHARWASPASPGEPGATVVRTVERERLVVRATQVSSHTEAAVLLPVHAPPAGVPDPPSGGRGERRPPVAEPAPAGAPERPLAMAPGPRGSPSAPPLAPGVPDSPAHPVTEARPSPPALMTPTPAPPDTSLPHLARAPVPPPLPPHASASARDVMSLPVATPRPEPRGEAPRPAPLPSPPSSTVRPVSVVPRAVPPPEAPRPLAVRPRGASPTDASTALPTASPLSARVPAMPSLPAPPERPVVTPRPLSSPPSLPDAPPESMSAPSLPRVAPTPREAQAEVSLPPARLPHVRAASRPEPAGSEVPPGINREQARALPATIVPATPVTTLVTPVPPVAPGLSSPPRAAAPFSSPEELELLVDKVQRKLLRRLSAERERKGGL
jgi:hypothetical protein